jgi:hypothetical protein
MSPLNKSFDVCDQLQLIDTPGLDLVDVESDAMLVLKTVTGNREDIYSSTLQQPNEAMQEMTFELHNDLLGHPLDGLIICVSATASQNELDSLHKLHKLLLRASKILADNKKRAEGEG